MSVIATKLQTTAGAAIIATAAVLTPGIAHATPSLAPFTQGLGEEAAALVDPVIIVAPSAPVATPGSNKSAAASAVPAPPSQIIQTFIDGLVLGTQNFFKAGAQGIGSFVYGGLAFTGLAFAAVGEILPGPLGDAFSNVGVGFNNAANSVAQAVKIGPYSTSS
jgi:hypothetical protein